MVEYDIMLSKVNIGGVSGLISRLDEISCVLGALGSEMSVLTSDNHALEAPPARRNRRVVRARGGRKSGSFGTRPGQGGRLHRSGALHWRIGRTVDQRTGEVWQTRFLSVLGPASPLERPVTQAGAEKLSNGQFSNGDPIMLICEFTIEDPEARAASAEQAKQKLAALESGEWDGSQEEEVVESPGVLDALDELLDD